MDIDRFSIQEQEQMEDSQDSDVWLSYFFLTDLFRLQAKHGAVPTHMTYVTASLT